MEKTAVEWLKDYIQNEINKYSIQPMDINAIYALNHIKEFACSKANEIFEQQIKDAYQTSHISMMTADQYYTEKFK
jgi:hypothetical protein